jgi:hypothetical protein
MPSCDLFKMKDMNPDLVVYLYNLRTWTLRQEDHKFEPNLSYIASSKPAWVT